ncbi:MAG: DUF429 domain-containing protein [Pseudomonadota bacterium]
MTQVAGIDGCRAGWLVVRALAGAWGEATAALAPDFSTATTGARPVLVDMPVGLSEAPGGRALDAELRTFLRDHADGLRGVGSRVFAPPSRPTLEQFRAGADYAPLNAALPPGRRLSRQAFNITAKIAEVDAWMTPARQRWCREAHPEIAFTLLTGRTLPPKKSADGRAARRSALAAQGFRIGRLASGLGRRTGRWGEDDLLDAAVLAWSAARVAAGMARSFGGTRDARGLRMEVVA